MLTKTEKYGKFMAAIAPYIGQIKDDISKGPGKKAIYKSIDIAKMMGPEFEKMQPKTIYEDSLFVLFLEGIFVQQSIEKGTGEHLLVMRLATEEDALPPHIARYLED